MTTKEKEYYLAFSVFEGIGIKRFKLLLDYFGSAEKAFRASVSELKAIGLGEKLTERFLSFRLKFDPGSYYFRIQKMGIEAVCDEEENYPRLLKEVEDRPFVLYVKTPLGSAVSPLDQGETAEGFKTIAIVGTRQMTAYGKEVTEKLTQDLVKNNFTIISGLAYGVDRVAHETALKYKGITLAVFGTGLETVYPREHFGLAQRILENGGALISEVPPFGTINKGTFRARDRIISGLSLGVVVTEAGERSGSMITASCAAEQGREVFAVPGPINSPGSAGTSALIKKGAKLVYNVGDILEEL